MNNMLHFWSPFLKIKRRAAEIFSTILVLDTNSLQIFFEINEKKERPDGWRIAPPWKVDYLSSNPIHTSISSIGIYQICTVKNGYKKAQMPCDIWFFGVGIQIGCITWVVWPIWMQEFIRCHSSEYFSSSPLSKSFARSESQSINFKAACSPAACIFRKIIFIV